jgi:cytochrome c553
MISGQNNAYIVAALNAYKKGDRKHPTMRAIAGSLSDQDIADLAAFYATNATTSPLLLPSSASPSAWAGAAADLLKKGNCASCHGTDFNHPIDGSYPKLAGQYGDYLFVALKAYGTENNDKVGRAHPIMSTQVKPFSHAELKVLADYLGSLPGTLETVPQSKFR